MGELFKVVSFNFPIVGSSFNYTWSVTSLMSNLNGWASNQELGFLNWISTLIFNFTSWVSSLEISLLNWVSSLISNVSTWMAQSYPVPIGGAIYYVQGTEIIVVLILLAFVFLALTRKR